MERIPHLYVETDVSQCIKDGKCIQDCLVILEKIEVWLAEGDELPEFIKPANAKFLRRDIYDRFYYYVDKITGRVERDMVLVLPDGRTRIYLKKEDELMLLPVEGFSKTLIANVGNRVRKGDAFAAVTTKKGEVHYLKPPKAGTVVFIDEVSNHPHYVYYILPEE